MTNNKLITYCYENQEINLLSTFLSLRYSFVNHSIYTCSATRVALLIGISRKMAGRRIQELIKRGWCTMHDGTLKCHHLKTICHLEGIKPGHTIKIQYSKSFKETKLQLQRAIFHSAMLSQAYMQEQIVNLCSRDKTKLKKAVKASQKYPGIHPTELRQVLNISLHGIGKLLFCSKSTAFRIKQAFSRRSWYRFIRRYTMVLKGANKLTLIMLRDMNPGIPLILKGDTIYKPEPSEVQILPAGKVFKEPGPRAFSSLYKSVDNTTTAGRRQRV